MSESLKEEDGMAIGHLLPATLAATAVKRGRPGWLDVLVLLFSCVLDQRWSRGQGEASATGAGDPVCHGPLRGVRRGR